MKIPKISYRAVAIITIVVSVFGLIASPVSAAAFPVSGNTAVHHASNSTRQSGRLQSAITTLGQSGVDVSQVQADLASGNMSAAMQWMAAYHTSRPERQPDH